MLHKGNISNIHICPEDVVDCVIGGSPCQDLSVAGLRKGIKHESKGDGETTRSGLFMEQIRIIKEMRDVDKRAGRTGVDIRPRWAVWENVPGALSSGKPKGEDFRIVLEEFAKIADPAVTIPGPPRGGWQPAGCIVGDGFSVAWRIMDASYHGVPQRRRRIALVCDFAADGAPAVLFDEEGMRWDFETSQRAWKGIAPYFAGCAAGSDRPGLGSDRGVSPVGINGDVAGTLDSNYFKGCGERQGVEREVVAVPDVVFGIDQQSDKGNVVCREVYAFTQNQREEVRDLGEIAGSVSSQTGTHQQTYVAMPFVGSQGEKADVIGCGDGETTTLKNATDGSNATPDVVFGINQQGEKGGANYAGADDCEGVGRELTGATAYGVTTKGNGDAFAFPEQHTALSTGGGQAGQGYPCVVVPYTLKNRCGDEDGKGGANYAEGVMPTLCSDSHGTPHGVVYAVDGNVCDRVSAKNGCGYSKDVSPTLNTQDRHAVVYDARGNGDGEIVQTLTGDHARSVSDYTPIVCSIDGRNCTMNEEISATLQAKSTGGQSLNCINPVCIERTHYAEKSYGEYSEGEGTLKASGGSAGNGSETLACEPASVYWDGGQVANTLTRKGMDQRMPDKGQFQCVLQPKHRKYIVRRLTPLEYSRLQGMPDDWCDIPAQSNVTQEDLEHWRHILDEWAAINGKKPKSDAQIVKWLSSPVSESAQYQMYGNGIALPQWVWVCGRIIETYGEHKPTMASLFDGTGSFPLIWNSILGGAYTAWSSEVNPDAIRVSKYRMEERGW